MSAFINVRLVTTQCAVREMPLGHEIGNFAAGEQPLSVEKTIRVLSVNFFLSKLLSTSPTTQSVSMRKSPYLPMLDFPCQALLGKIGVWGEVSGR